MRVFAALPLPEEVQDHLDLTVGAMVPDAADVDPRRGPQPVRWVPRHRRHITLAFYGEVPDGAVPALAADLAGRLAVQPPLQLQLRGAGVFSHRTLWVGVRELDGEDRELIRLMGVCEDVGELYARVERRDRRRAHVTLARLRARRPDAVSLEQRAQALAVYSGPPWLADRVQVLSSELGAGKGGGPRYEQVADVPLGE